MTTISAIKPRHRLSGNRWWFGVLPFLILFGVAFGDGAAVASSPPADEVPGLDKAFQPSIAVVVMVIISALFFIGFFSIYVRYCASQLDSNLSVLPRFGLSLRVAQRGLEPAVIESLPTFVYADVKGMKMGKGGTECAICLSEFDNGDTIRLLPKCSHAFHTDCIDLWLASHVTCPVCRANLQETVLADADARVAEIDILETDRANDTGNQVAIPVADEEDNSIVRIGSLQVPAASTSLRFPAKGRVKSMWKFSRSHSTGHSIVPAESLERFTLKLPDNVQKQILAGRVRPVGGGSSHGGRRVGEESSQWTFSIATPYIQRSVSGNPNRSVEAESSDTNPNGSEPELEPTRPNSLSSKSEAGDRSSTPA